MYGQLHNAIEVGGEEIKKKERNIKRQDWRGRERRKGRKEGRELIMECSLYRFPVDIDSEKKEDYSFLCVYMIIIPHI
jgi:hypothetical protein